MIGESNTGYYTKMNTQIGIVGGYQKKVIYL